MRCEFADPANPKQEGPISGPSSGHGKRVFDSEELTIEKRAFRDFRQFLYGAAKLRSRENNPGLSKSLRQPKVEHWSFLGTSAVNHVLNETQ
jgi:hypothetical protein